ESPSRDGPDPHGSLGAVAFDEAGMRERLLDLATACSVVRVDGRLGVVTDGVECGGDHQAGPVVDRPGGSGPLLPEQFGDPAFRRLFGVRLAYAAGAMANGIASEELVTTLGQHGILSSFGAAGLVPARIEEAIRRITA